MKCIINDQAHILEYVIYHMTDSVYFGDMMRTLHEILDELKLMNKKLDKLIGEK